MQFKYYLPHIFIWGIVSQNMHNNRCVHVYVREQGYALLSYHFLLPLINSWQHDAANDISHGGLMQLDGNEFISQHLFMWTYCVLNHSVWPELPGNYCKINRKQNIVTLCKMLHNPGPFFFGWWLMKDTTELKVNSLGQGPNHGGLAVLGLERMTFWINASYLN